MSEIHFGVFSFTRCRYHRRALSHTKFIQWTSLSADERRVYDRLFREFRLVIYGVAYNSMDPVLYSFTN